MKKLMQQIMKFGIVGVIAFLIDSGLLYVLTEFCHVYYFYSAMISFTVSLAFNYWASIRYVFDVNHKQTFRDIVLFVIFSVFGLGINQGVMYVMVEMFTIYYMFSKVVATGIVMVWNFITRKIFIEKH